MTISLLLLNILVRCASHDKSHAIISVYLAKGFALLKWGFAHSGMVKHVEERGREPFSFYPVPRESRALIVNLSCTLFILIQDRSMRKVMKILVV